MTLTNEFLTPFQVKYRSLLSPQVKIHGYDRMIGVKYELSARYY